MANYFDFLDQASVGKNYDWSSLHINLNFDKSEIDLDAILNREKTFGNSTNEALFIHEYVHFIQNFYCNSGALTFCEYVLALEKLGASKLNEDFKLPLPLKITDQPGADLWNSGVQHYKKFGQLLGTDDGNIQFERLKPYPEHSIKEKSNKLIINNGLISYTVNSKTVREHMAELSSLLYLNYSDEQIHDRFISSSALCSTLGSLDKQPMYWMLFEYFYSNRYTNIAEGLVLLTHSALCDVTPVSTVVRFFDFIQDKKDKELVSLVKWFLDTPVEVQVFSFSFNAAITQIISQLKLCTKHGETHDFYKFNATLFSILMLNIKNYYSAKLFFKDPIRLRDKSFWVRIIADTGTPIIRYKDRTPVITTSNKELINSLTYFLGVSKVLENLQGTKTQCPFHTEFNICKAIYRDNDKCLHEPLTVKNPIGNGEECHYQNAIILLGLDSRII